jgi:hypothetical protein
MRSAAYVVSVAAVALLAGGDVAAQDLPDNGRRAWGGSAALYGFFVPDGPAFPMAVAAADSDAVHIEGHYNYESLNTGAIFIGRSVGRGEGLAVRATLMAGGVFGEVYGFAPGFRMETSFHRFDLSVEAEYVIDVGNVADTFFYNWSELGYAVLDWLRVGLVEQRMRFHQGGLHVEAGLLLGFSFRNLAFTVYEFGAGWTDPTLVCALSAGF